MIMKEVKSSRYHYNLYASAAGVSYVDTTHLMKYINYDYYYSTKRINS